MVQNLMKEVDQTGEVTMVAKEPSANSKIGDSGALNAQGSSSAFSSSLINPWRRSFTDNIVAIIDTSACVPLPVFVRSFKPARAAIAPCNPV